MNRQWILAALLGLTTVALADHGGKTPGDWYENDYAPLWTDAPWDSVDAIAGHYATTFTAHSADGSIDTVESRESLSSSIDGWRQEGWVSSQLVALQTDVLNPSTSVFKAKWLDVYSDGSEEMSCGWYLADYSDNRWSFTAYADLDCDAHGL